MKIQVKSVDTDINGFLKFFILENFVLKFSIPVFFQYSNNFLRNQLSLFPDLSLSIRRKSSKINEFPIQLVYQEIANKMPSKIRTRGRFFSII